MTSNVKHRTRRTFLKTTSSAIGLASIGWPALSFAQNNPIRVAMPTILSGRVAQLGTSSRNAVMLEVDKFNEAGGLNGRPIEMVIRDSRGQPQEAARVTRELINSDDCELLLDCEASSGAFAVHEVARDLGIFCLHSISETSSLTADPKLRSPNTFRTARQGIHDSIVGGAYAAKVAKEQGITQWMGCSPDYAYGRDTTAEFFEYLQHFNPDIELLGDVWPKLFQSDYSEVITQILRKKPQAVYSCLWGGDLTSFIDQGNIYGLFADRSFFAVNMADYTALTVVKNLPESLHSGNRYIAAFPATEKNRDWADAYFEKHNELPTNWSWQAATGVQFLVAAMEKANSTDGEKLAEVMHDLTIESPFGADGTITMRGEDQTMVNYAVGWGEVIADDPYLPDPQAGSWEQIFELEKEWKERNGYL
ncbi:MAG TPA: ABC transporter substrate-binding protein [Burkholderiaceae bacterium]|nr:ABC transporter substrate-binding protein [Burkholderiaceae bacterium]